MQQEIESLITQTLGDNARFTSLTFRGETWDAWIRPTLNYNNELDPDDELIERHYLAIVRTVFDKKATHPLGCK